MWRPNLEKIANASKQDWESICVIGLWKQLQSAEWIRTQGESADKTLQHHLTSLIVRMLVSQGKPRFPRRWPRFLTYEDKDGTKEEPKKEKKVRSLFKLGCTIYFRIFVTSTCSNARVNIKEKNLYHKME